MAGSVVVTVGDAHEALLPPLVEATRALRVGDGLEEATDVGPVISCAARDRIAGWIERAAADGGDARRRRTRERRAACPTAGAFLGPTILDDVTPEMAIAQEEVFGPVLDDHPRRTRSTRRSTSSAAAASATARRSSPSPPPRSAATATRSQAGMVGVNIGVAAPVAFFPFSGWKDSFLGDLHAHGTDAVDFFTRKKTVTSRYFSDGQGHGAYFVER